MDDVVIDASVAVLWFFDQSGDVEARDLLARHILGDLTVHLPRHCLVETLAVVTARRGVGLGHRAFEVLREASVSVHDADDDLIDDALATCAKTGCSLYDAIPIALAHRLGATLCSADARAHAGVANVMLIGNAAP